LCSPIELIDEKNIQPLIMLCYTRGLSVQARAFGMAVGLVEVVVEVVALTLQPLPLVLALGLALLIRGGLHAALSVVNLWLLTELAATVLDPGYRFGSLMLERLFASALQIAIASAALAAWRHWRTAASSVTAH
jgi:uncharacterized membrane protein YvlD (DUF360 family)